MVKSVTFGGTTLDRREGLDERAQQFVPKWNPQLEVDMAIFADLALAIGMDQPVLVVGPTGSGKTSHIKQIAAALNQPVRRVNLSANIRMSSLLGQMVAIASEEGGQTETLWVDGPVTDALRNGYWLLLDEFDACPAGVSMALQSVLEPERQLVLADNQGEIPTPHPEFRIFATANTLGRGDDSGLYAGTNVMNEATLDRFVVLTQGYPGKKVETAVCVGAGIDAALAERMYEVVALARNGFDRDNPETMQTFSTRRLERWAATTARIAGVSNGAKATAADAARAYRLVVLNKMGKADERYFASCFQKTLGIDPTSGR